MISRRRTLVGFAGLSMPAVLAGCSKRPAPSAGLVSLAPEPSRPNVVGIDAVIDISHNVTVSDFHAVRRSGNIMGVIHKSSEGGDWIDPSYGVRRPQAEAAGLLWGAYHFGTRQYSGERQAATFLSAVKPGPTTVMALDFEPNDHNPRNTMTLAQAEQFVRTVEQATGRLPMLYTHPNWANGGRTGRARLSLGQPIGSNSILARCDLWLADYREEPEVPMAWAGRGWRMWQYAGDDTEDKAAYGTVPRSIAGVSHSDRNIFAGDSNALQRFWRRGGASV
jgi:lysozyme